MIAARLHPAAFGMACVLGAVGAAVAQPVAPVAIRNARIVPVSGPTIAAGAITLGVMQQIMRAFDRVENSFQFLVNSWSTIVELMSIYKRLNAFEKQFKGRTVEDSGDIGGSGMGGSEGGVGANA